MEDESAFLLFIHTLASRAPNSCHPSWLCEESWDGFTERKFTWIWNVYLTHTLRISIHYSWLISMLGQISSTLSVWGQVIWARLRNLRMVRTYIVGIAECSSWCVNLWVFKFNFQFISCIFIKIHCFVFLIISQIQNFCK